MFVWDRLLVPGVSHTNNQGFDVKFTQHRLTGQKNPPYATDHVCVYNYGFYIYCISKHVAHAVHLVYYIKQTLEKTEGQYRMHNPETLQHWVHKTQDEDK